jgi:hypothetical protein
MNSLIYPTRYKLDTYIPDYRINKKEINKNFFYIYFGETMIDEFSKDKISFLHDSIFDLTDQKENLCSCENMFNICKMIVDIISIYENSFDLLISSYVILKRIYFAFPQYIGSIEDCLVLVLCNICLLKSQVQIILIKKEIDSSKEALSFIKYLLSDKEVKESLRQKLTKRLELKKVQLDFREIPSNSKFILFQFMIY